MIGLNIFCSFLAAIFFMGFLFIPFWIKPKTTKTWYFCYRPVFRRKAQEFETDFIRHFNSLGDDTIKGHFYLS